MRTAVVLSTMALAVLCAGAAPKPVPSSPYIGIVYRYADAMLAHGRDVYGPEKTGLLLSAMDRVRLVPLQERPIANARHDQNLLRVLYTLSELSGKPAYREAADAELKWLLNLPLKGDLPAWDAFAWDVSRDEVFGGAGGGATTRVWLLWDKAFALDPQNAKRLAQGVARLGEPRSPREAGEQIRALATAFEHTSDVEMHRSVGAVLTGLENTRGPGSSAQWLSAAIDCAGAAGRVGEPLATRARAFAARQDQAFCAPEHPLKDKGGFTLTTQRGGTRVTELWSAHPEAPTTATVAMMCVSRYENGGDLRYRDLIHAAADCYRDALPADDVDAWPMTFGHAISLEIAAWRSTARQEYLDAARRLADAAIQRFWSDNPLPRSGIRTNHYDTATGVDTLALALIELHLHVLHITAVRCPPNTIDR